MKNFLTKVSLTYLLFLLSAKYTYANEGGKIMANAGLFFISIAMIIILIIVLIFIIVKSTKKK